jgi:hypothetical protein
MAAQDDAEGVEVLKNFVEELSFKKGLGYPFGSPGNVIMNKFNQDLDSNAKFLANNQNKVYDTVNKIRNSQDFISAFKILKAYIETLTE